MLKGFERHPSSAGKRRALRCWSRLQSLDANAAGPFYQSCTKNASLRPQRR